MTEIAYIALGSNLGDRHAYLAQAREAIAAIPECRVVAASRSRKRRHSAASLNPPYLNQMLAVETTLDPVALLAQLQRIEADERASPRDALVVPYSRSRHRAASTIAS